MGALLPPAGSLRRSVLTGTAVSVLLLLAALTFLMRVHADMRATLTTATETFIQEQAIADRLLRAASVQLVAASQAGGPRDADVLRQFRAAGADVYEQIRLYLFRKLTLAQRQGLEEVREEHQRLEAAAAEAFALHAAGEEAQAATATAAALERAFQLQAALDVFLDLREADLAALREGQDAAFARLWTGALGFAGLALLVPVLLVSLLDRRLSRPLEALADAAARVGAGERGVRLAVARLDELGAAAASFNDMADRLDRAREELGRSNEELAATVAELEAAQTEMVQTEKLTAVGRMMAGLAHELNNPLASVLGYCELLQERLREEADPVARELDERFVHPLVEEARRARSLVRHLLGFTRRSEAELDGISLRTAVEQVAALRRYAFEQAGLRLLLDVPDVLVRAEPQRLQQTFLNLVNNAYDAMAPAAQGTLRIVGRVLGDGVELRFEDEGPGFEDDSRIFEPFYTTKAPGEGTGLGLSLVHRFMREFGGTARAESRVGGGARVVLVFQPGRPGSEPAAGAGATAGVAGAETAPEGDPQEGQGGGAEAAAPKKPPAAGSLAGRTVLVVEDEAPLREVQRRFLGRLDAEVLLAASVLEARSILESRFVDVVVSDVKMPGGSGVELYRWVERERPALAAHFLFVTGDISDADVARLADSAPGQVLRKPFLMSEYLDRVRAVTPPPAVGAP